MPRQPRTTPLELRLPPEDIEPVPHVTHKSLHAKVERIYSWGTMAAGAAIASVFIISQVISLINSVATKQQVETLDTKITKINETLTTLNAKNQIFYDTVIEWLEIEAGRLAAELEEDPKIKSKASLSARKIYREAIKAGYTPIEALRTSAATHSDY